MDFDKFGYYIGAGRKTYSRIEAMEYAKGTDIQWNFNDEVFSAFDWTKEPQQDLNYFYDLRAQQLRNEYDYIVLFYSGGYDSHNILKTFIDNNLHIDEILTTIPSLDTFSTPTIEYTRYTSKKLEYYKSQLPNTKIRLVEHKQLLIDEMNKNPDIMYSLNYKHTLYHLIKDKYKFILDEHRKKVEQGKKIVYLYGIDKPYVINEKGHWFMKFSEFCVVNKVMPEIQTNKITDVHYEFFYWDPSCVPLLIKQAHTIKNLYKKTVATTDTPIFNNMIYPRCLSDEFLGFFDENQFRPIFRNINSKRGINRIACEAGRDSWFYVKSDQIVLNVLKYSSEIVKKYPTMKSSEKKYFIGH